MNASKPPGSVKDLVELLRWRVEMSPKRGFRFLEDGEQDQRQLSFADLQRRARAIGARIQQEAEPGERAILLYPPSLEYIEAFFGCLYAGVVAVPAYPPNPRRLKRTLPRLLSIVDDASATLALGTEMITGMARGMGGEEVEMSDLRWIATDAVDDEWEDRWQHPDVDAETVAFLQYTSGSTGMPKGVVLDHGTLLRNEELIHQAFGAGVDDVGVNWLPLYHDMGLIGAVIQPVYCGCESVLMSPLDFLKRPARWLEAIDRFDGSMSTAPNFGYDLAVRKTPKELRDRLDLSSWKVACNGAEPIREETMRRFADYFGDAGFDETAFMPAYGLAEVGLIVSATPREETPRVVETDDKEHISCGQLLGDFEVRIVDPDTSKVLDDGEVGEIWLRNGSVASGYWKKPQVNEEIFGACVQGEQEDEPFLKTGDLGFIDDGELVISGRLKDLIVIRGANHYPQDIEKTVEGVHPAIRPGCGAAFAVNTDSDEEGLVVVQEVKPDAVDDLDELVGSIREAITQMHRLTPHEVVLIEPRTIEKTSSGKIQRYAVKESWQQSELDELVRSGVGQEKTDQPKRRPQSNIEQWLVGRVAEEAQLDAGDVDLDRPFSAFGIDSASAAGIVGELEEWLGTEIEATALYDFPNIAALAAHLSGDEDGQRRRPHTESGRTVGFDDDQAVAVVGMACRFPGAENVEQFWELLERGEDAFRVVSSRRWEPETFTDPDIAGFDTMATDRGGFLDEIDRFDPSFFGISPREAKAMDPQQRLVMETGWHAIEDASLTKEELAGSATGVFIGQSASDFARLYEGTPVRAGSGLAPSISANRLSYWLDLRGPSLTVDTACSSSLAAVDQAVMNLRAGRCDNAIVGGVNVILAPDMSVAFSQARMLSPDGVCRVFDEDANGYVRGEGCGMVVLKRLEDAIRDGDHIRGVIRGVAVNQDGATNGLTAPNGQSQREVIEAAIQDAGVDPETIGAIEAHGTGTELGDAIEVKALQKVFGPPTDGDGPRWLGSAKAAIGHLEAAAGVAGLIKALLVVGRGVIPPQPNFTTPNPACEFDGSGFDVARDPQKWTEPSGEASSPRRIGVSAFGFGGTNVHLVVEEPPEHNAAPPEQREKTTFERDRFWPDDDEMRMMKPGE